MNKSSLQAIHRHLVADLIDVEERLNTEKFLRDGYFKLCDVNQQYTKYNHTRGKICGNKVRSLEKKKAKLVDLIKQTKKSIQVYGFIQNTSPTSIGGWKIVKSDGSEDDFQEAGTISPHWVGLITGILIGVIGMAVLLWILKIPVIPV